MARYVHLPIYITAFSILKELYIRVPKFGKQYKYMLGNRLLDAAQEIIVLIIQANNDRQTRIQKIDELRKHAEAITILSRIGDELNQWGGQKIYLAFAEKLVSLSRQAEGWRKNTL